MRGEKDEEKMMSPMFPRLHVNDAEKGGPRAPPRNKMALLVPSISSSHGTGHERSVFTPFCNSPTPLHLTEKLFYYSSGGVKSSALMTSLEEKSVEVANDQSLNTSRPLSSSAICDSFQPHNFPDLKNFSWKKLGDENDSRFHSSSQSGSNPYCNSSQHSKDQENQPCLNLSFSVQFQNTSETQKKGSGTINVKEIDHMRIQIEDNGKVFEACQNSMEKFAAVATIKDIPSVDASSSSSGKIKSTKSLKRTCSSSNQDNRKNSVNVLKCLPGNEMLNPELATTPDKTVIRDNILVEYRVVTSKENPSMVRSELYSRALLQDGNKNCCLEKGRKYCDDKQSGSLKAGDLERNDDAAETSVVDSIISLEITPDDVVGVIGEKQFWKARRAIVNQQRVFAVQVFELHRLIKVQKLIAGSPHLLLEDNIYVGRASLKVSPINKVPSKCAMAVKPRDHSQKQHTSADFAEENLPVAITAKPSPWCFPPPGNQWLVPVMLPSEGFVYKPYSGPCPPVARFMAPVYGSCGPISLAPGGGDFLNAAYSVSASNHQEVGMLPGNPHFGQTFFQPFGMPVMNPSVCDSAVEQISPHIGPQSKDNHLSVGDIHFNIPLQSSCNMPNQMSRVVSCCAENFQGLKESEIEGSTAGSLSEMPKANALALFPMEPTLQASYPNAQTNEQQGRVIKAVPRNPRSATESAARIYQSIQEERNQYD
ncbi:PROTEIN EARLY FLOWERING 3 [Salix viminalis]|uniref:PROTEIN EARLY FLOWERING 3 n=1 Tax=Salix viminalis TaxID=40686 RepID=A0A9Q0QD14_SALVM|nr:PROTEIN EARLY FLOWERING 3 [Salix viminalis]